MGIYTPSIGLIFPSPNTGNNGNSEFRLPALRIFFAEMTATSGDLAKNRLKIFKNALCRLPTSANNISVQTALRITISRLNLGRMGNPEGSHSTYLHASPQHVIRWDRITPNQVRHRSSAVSIKRLKNSTFSLVLNKHNKPLEFFGAAGCFCSCFV